MKQKREGFFWVSFTDLMTSLFFIMLVLYVLTYVMLKKKEKQLIANNEDLRNKLKVYEIVEQNLKPLKEDTALFRYEPPFKRFTLAFDVKFVTGETGINQQDLENYSYTIDKIDKAGNKLKLIIDSLQHQKSIDPKLKNVS
jgi:hypothetical protein